jgi:site-specific DNA recombinase
MEASKMVRAAIYARISEDRRHLAEGVLRQLDIGREIAARKGWVVAEEDIYVDNDVKASKGSKRAREGYEQLLAKLADGQLDAVVVSMEDRLQRQVIELAEFLKVCEDARVTRLASVGGEFDLSDPDQRTRLYIKAAFAESEIERMRERARQHRLALAQQGEDNGGGERPFGFVGKGQNRVSPVRALAEQDLLREAINRVIAGDSLRSIARDWNERGSRTTNGNLWRNAKLRQVLVNPRYAGYRRHLGKLYPAKWEAVVDPEFWERARTILEDPARVTNHRGRAPAYLLTGMAFCAVCGARMRGRLHPGKGHGPVYACEGKHCTSRHLERVDEEITARVLYRLGSPQFAEEAGASEEDPTREIYSTLAHDQGLLDRLQDKVAQELISPQTAKRNRAEIEQRMDRNRERLVRLAGGRVLAHIPPNVGDVWPNLSLDRRRAILSALIDRVVVYPQGRGARTFDPEKIRVLWKA